jgi:N-acetylmuramic acid 6-phosphate etherase
MLTERRNPRSVDIDLFPTERILRIINAEDALIASAVGATIPQISKAVDLAVGAIRGGGRVLYVGAGTSGRIAALDAAECPSTFSTPADWVEAVIAGGTKALVHAVESAEDDAAKAAADMKSRKIGAKDVIIGLAASGKTPYTSAALEYARTKGAKTVAIVAAEDTPIAKIVDVAIETLVGPEIVTGSTRMKAGTAQKLVLNMISTTTMIRLGMTYSNWMINLTMTNTKLRARGVHMLQEILGVSREEAHKLSEGSGGKLKVAVLMGALGCSRKDAEERLAQGDGNLRKVLGNLGSGRE